MKVTFLGTGTSTGVPEIGCQCEVCQSKDPRDKRYRSSVLIEIDGKRILIDCGPDFRCQMLREGIDSLDALLITHEHYDHVGGLDDLRPLYFEKPFPIYLEANVAEAIETRMPYAFMHRQYPGIPHYDLTTITLEPFEAVGVQIIPIRIMHARLPIVGYRIGNFAYLSDVKDIPEAEFKKLKEVDTLVIEALRTYPHNTHITLNDALAYIERIQPRMAYLTHMSHRIGLHEQLCRELPENVKPGYDGQVVEVW